MLSLLGISCVLSILFCGGCLISLIYGGKLVELIFLRCLKILLLVFLGIWGLVLVFKLRNKSFRNVEKLGFSCVLWEMFY